MNEQHSVVGAVANPTSIKEGQGGCATPGGEGGIDKERLPPRPGVRPNLVSQQRQCYRSSSAGPLIAHKELLSFCCRIAASLI